MPRTEQRPSTATRQMAMFQCRSGGGCGNIYPADQIQAKTKQKMQRDGNGQEQIDNVPLPNENTPKVLRFVCPHCSNWRALDNGNMRFVGYGDIEVLEEN